MDMEPSLLEHFPLCTGFPTFSQLKVTTRELDAPCTMRAPAPTD
eukprot:CAMPEP_0206046952 /NCGR_PEP_ID=MMETSP1466-20131121/19986_1 /ASSEMBLY_ACC=CAM_ASM_001126 /TAXON_ID=44452 /ORGANISM="Pavlova gyrans, Strain CCMP608" /LENGTH=43 /DNA_ID= /DNA_START= /DNA_END= /DNA_ORIENTATION=